MDNGNVTTTVAPETTDTTTQGQVTTTVTTEVSTTTEATTTESTTETTTEAPQTTETTTEAVNQSVLDAGRDNLSGAVTAADIDFQSAEQSIEAGEARLEEARVDAMTNHAAATGTGVETSTEEEITQ